MSNDRSYGRIGTDDLHWCLMALLVHGEKKLFGGRYVSEVLFTYPSITSSLEAMLCLVVLLPMLPLKLLLLLLLLLRNRTCVINPEFLAYGMFSLAKAGRGPSAGTGRQSSQSCSFMLFVLKNLNRKKRCSRNISQIPWCVSNVSVCPLIENTAWTVWHASCVCWPQVSPWGKWRSGGKHLVTSYPPWGNNYKKQKSG